MPIIHYHRRRTAGEREVDDAIRRAQASERELERRLDLLAREIAETRRFAERAGVLDVWPVFPRDLAARDGRHARSVDRRERHVAPRHVLGTATH